MDYVSGCGGELTSRLTLQAYSSDIIVIHQDAWPRRSATPNPAVPPIFLPLGFRQFLGLERARAPVATLLASRGQKEFQGGTWRASNPRRRRRGGAVM